MLARWVLNLPLYTAFLLDPSKYRTLVAMGQACYIEVAGYPQDGRRQDPGPQPVCWYDPGNTNLGALPLHDIR